MTAEEQALADDRMRAEIAKLIQESAKIRAETFHINERTSHTHQDIAKLQAETAKILAETAKISRERYWIPFTIFAGVVVAVISIVPRLFGG